MWLINTSTLALQEFTDHATIPPYAILSHCWGKDEMLFKDFRKKRKCTGQGYEKIVNCCTYATTVVWQNEQLLPSGKGFEGKIVMRRGLEWVWVDTCCIDKRSSSELSEAINSSVSNLLQVAIPCKMSTDIPVFAWYRNAHICFAYLGDFDLKGRTIETEGAVQEFQRSRWFRRGWTLQELIAPPQVVFLDANWLYIGVKRAKSLHTATMKPILTPLISACTGLPERLLLKRGTLKGYSVAQRMSWASARSTTRVEDIAYSLLGLFDIEMPLLYGEGIKAFRRLQHEILKRELGESLFAWRPTAELPIRREYQLFAASPAHFRDSAEVVDVSRRSGPLFSSRGHWVELRIPEAPQTAVFEATGLIVRLACGRWGGEGEKQFTPCVLQLAQLLGSKHLLRSRGSGYDGYFDEAEIAAASESCKPVLGGGTRYILMHSGEAEPRRWAASTFDIEDSKPEMNWKVKIARTSRFGSSEAHPALEYTPFSDIGGGGTLS